MTEIAALVGRIERVERALQRWRIAGVIAIGCAGGSVAVSCHHEAVVAPPTRLELKEPGSNNRVTIDGNGIKLFAAPGDAPALELSASGVALGGAAGTVQLKPGSVVASAKAGDSVLTAGGLDIRDAAGHHHVQVKTDRDDAVIRMTAEDVDVKGVTTSLDLLATDHGIAGVLGHSSVDIVRPGTHFNLAVDHTGASLTVSKDAATKSLGVGQ